MKELEDSHFFPNFLRNFQTEFIGFVVARFNIYRAFANYINSLSLTQGRMTDLCSGSGEPAISIFRKSNCFSHLILSDKFPNQLPFSDDKISYLMQSVDVLEMEFQPDTFYTMFNAFHHFRDADKLRIAERIKKSGSRIFFVEILEPGIVCLLKVLFVTTVGNFLFTPFVRPFSFSRLFFTYIIPVNILTITYDGIVSVFKSLSVKEYKTLFGNHRDLVEVFKLKEGFSSLIVIKIQS